MERNKCTKKVNCEIRVSSEIATKESKYRKTLAFPCHFVYFAHSIEHRLCECAVDVKLSC